MDNSHLQRYDKGMGSEVTHLNFRADSKDVKKLQSLARQSNISSNALLSQILKSHLDWEYIAPKIGMIPVQKDTLREVFDFISDEELKKIAVRAADKFMDKLMMITGKNSLDSFLNITRTRLEKSGFALVESTDKGKMQLVIQHGMGRKWSVFFSAYHERIINNLEHSTEIEVKDDLWIIWISQYKVMPDLKG